MYFAPYNVWILQHLYGLYTCGIVPYFLSVLKVSSFFLGPILKLSLGSEVFVFLATETVRWICVELLLLDIHVFACIIFFQAIRKHKFVDILDNPGSADLSAYVDFAAIRHSAEEASGVSPHYVGSICIFFLLSPLSKYLIKSKCIWKLNWRRNNEINW